MENLISVSVIIAVYNDGKNISRCLDSLINQTLKNIQILCVNDASTDNTLEILNKYAEKDSRIVIINNAINGGIPSKARNKALEYVEGQYIALIDSDDYVSKDYLEQAYEIAIDTGANIVVNKEVASTDEEPFTVPDEWKTILQGDFKKGSILSSKEALIACLDGCKVHPRCLYKFTLLSNYKFDEDGIYGDEFSYHYLYSICKTVSFADGIYYYYKNESSVTHQRDDRKFDYIDRQLKVKDLMKKNDVYELFFHSFESRNLTLLKQYQYFYFRIRKRLTKEKKTKIKALLVKFYNSFNANDIFMLEKNKNPLVTALNKIRFSSYTLFYCTSWILSKFIK